MVAAIPLFLKRKALPIEKEAQKEGGPFWKTHSTQGVLAQDALLTGEAQIFSWMCLLQCGSDRCAFTWFLLITWNKPWVLVPQQCPGGALHRTVWNEPQLWRGDQEKQRALGVSWDVGKWKGNRLETWKQSTFEDWQTEKHQLSNLKESPKSKVSSRYLP